MNPAPAEVDELEQRIGYRFVDRSTLVAALTHTSAVGANEPRQYERLEFLGDAVVGLVISDLLLARYREEDEGRLSKFRSALVNAGSFARQARRLGLDQFLRLGRGEEKSGGRAKSSILADAYEALMGALFLDGGYSAAREVLEREFRDDIDNISTVECPDPKTELQERYQRSHHVTPTYRLIEASGPDHARIFCVEVLAGDLVLGSGEGTSKRSAEQSAARQALFGMHTPEAEAEEPSPQA